MIPKYISKISNSQATALGLKINEVLFNLDFSEDEKKLFAIFYNPFNIALYKLINHSQIDKKTFTVTEKNELNKQRENIFRGFKHLLNAYLLSGNSNKIIAAEKILDIIKNHIKTNAKNTQDEKTGSLASIIEEIESNAIGDLQLLDGKDWFDPLKLAQNNSINYETKLLAFKSDNRNDLSQIKINYFDSLLTFINYISYLQKISKCKKLDLFYTRVNVLILELTSKIKAKNRSYKIKKLEELSSKEVVNIPDQALTESTTSKENTFDDLSAELLAPIPFKKNQIHKACIKNVPRYHT